MGEGSGIDSGGWPRPIIVSGPPRSGTTWIGRTLAYSGQVCELYEPFNPQAHRARWFDPPESYLHIDATTAALHDWADEILMADSKPRDLVRDSALVWRVLAHVIDRYRRENPGWIVIRHEDLAADPISGFRRIYGSLSLRWDTDVTDRIAADTSAMNPAEVDSGDQHALTRDSRRLELLWRSRLSAEEAALVRAVVGDGIRFDYPDAWDAG